MIVEGTRAEAVRLERLVSNILDLARLRADALPNAQEPTDLTDVIDAAFSTLLVRLAGHRLKVSLPPDLPLVRSDPRILHHMLINLIDNAAKFSAPGSEITVSANRNPDGVTLIVRDEGRGLPTSLTNLPHRDTTDPVPGNGLGLIVVSGFARSLGIGFHAGHRADNQPGADMQLTFPFPLCVEPKETPT